jgi:hypothetical protein
MYTGMAPLQVVQILIVYLAFVMSEGDKMPGSEDAAMLLRRYNKWKESFEAAIAPPWHVFPSNPTRFYPDNDEPYEIFALQTFPHTGTHWTMKLFAAATGVFPESIYPQDVSRTTPHAASLRACLHMSMLQIPWNFMC